MFLIIRKHLVKQNYSVNQIKFSEEELEQLLEAFYNEWNDQLEAEMINKDELKACNVNANVADLGVDVQGIDMQGITWIYNKM